MCLVFVTGLHEERRMKIILLLLGIILCVENAEERLITTLLESYNKEIRPIRNVSEIIKVRFIMTLQQMISVIEKVSLDLDHRLNRYIKLKFKYDSILSIS